MPKSDKTVSLFKEKANAVSVTTTDAKTAKEALDYAVSVCDQKEAHQLLILPSGTEPSTHGEVPRAKTKIIAAPDLSQELFDYLTSIAKPKGIEVLREGLRSHMAGIDVCIAMAEFGLANTGTSVISTSNENAQLASMICEIFIVMLPTSTIYPDSEACADKLQELTSKEAAYTSFITGSSRTSDIERVLTLGVHGPLEMHVAFLEA